MSCTEHLHELESLRSQVAELSRALDERDRPMQDLCEQSGLLRAIVEGTATDTGEDFFRSLTKHLAQALNVRYAFVGKWKQKSPDSVRTLAVWSGTNFAEPFEYSLQHTPCANVIGQRLCLHESGVQRLFPKDHLLAQMNVESYCGMPLFDRSGQPLGLLVVMDDQPMTHIFVVKDLLQIFSARAAAELQRQQIEEELRCQRQHLTDAQALAHLGSWNWNIESGEEVWSDEQFRIFGYEPGSVNITYETFMAALLPDDHDLVLAAINEALLGKAPYDIECRIVRPNSDVREIHCRGNVQRDATGHPLSIAGTVLDITERKQTEKALRASEERWHLAVRGSNDGIWDWNIQTGDIFFSLRWKAMRGFADHELANHIDEWRSRIHPDDLDRVLQKIDAYLAKQAPEFCEEYRVQRKDGSYMWVLDRGAAIWADDGRPLRMAGSETDITERKRVEELILENRSLLQSFVEHTPAAIAMFDKDLRYVAVSKRWYEDYRLGNRNIIGLHHYDVFPEIQKMEHWQTIHRRCLAGEILRNDEECFVRADGEEDWLKWEILPWTDNAGSIGGIIMFTEIITARKQAERALQETEERYRLLTEATFDGVAIHDQGTLIEVNPGLERMFGYGPGELIGKHILDIVADESRELVIANMHKGVSGPYESVGRRKDGSTFYGEVVIKPYRYKGREVRLVAGRDITDRKRVEDTLAERAKLSAFAAEISATLNCSQSIEEALDQCVRLTVEHAVATFARIWTMGPGDLCGECANVSHCPDRIRCLHLTASAGLSTNLHGRYRRVPLGALKIGRIAQGAGMIATNDVLGDERLPDKEWMRKHGLQSFAGFPLTIEGQVYGVLGVFAQRLSPRQRCGPWNRSATGWPPPSCANRLSASCNSHNSRSITPSMQSTGSIERLGSSM